jgi:hypothetical protein
MQPKSPGDPWWLSSPRRRGTASAGRLPPFSPSFGPQHTDPAHTTLQPVRPNLATVPRGVLCRTPAPQGRTKSQTKVQKCRVPGFQDMSCSAGHANTPYLYVFCCKFIRNAPFRVVRVGSSSIMSSSQKRGSAAKPSRLPERMGPTRKGDKYGPEASGKRHGWDSVLCQAQPEKTRIKERQHETDW